LKENRQERQLPLCEQKTTYEFGMTGRIDFMPLTKKME